jgi:hypothetical protein
MPNEINVQAAVSLQRSTVGLQAVDSLPRDQTPGTKGLSTNVTVAANTDATGTQINASFNIGYLYVKNLDTSAQASSKDVSLSLVAWNSASPNQGPQKFARLRSNEFCLIPLSSLTFQSFYARSETSSTIAVQVVAIEQ